MDVDVPFLASLQLVLCHEEPPVQPLVEFVENQAAFGCYQGRVRVCVLLIPDKADRLTFDIDFIHQVDKIFLVVAIILVGLRNLRVEVLKNLLHDIVHFTDRDFLKPFVLNHADNRRHNIIKLLVGQRYHHTGSGLRDGVHDFLTVKGFQRSVFLNDFHAE